MNSILRIKVWFRGKPLMLETSEAKELMQNLAEEIERVEEFDKEFAEAWPNFPYRPYDLRD